MSISVLIFSQDSAKTTEPGENELTKIAPKDDKDVNFIDPPEILKDIDKSDMISILDKAYQEKKKRRKEWQQQQELQRQQKEQEQRPKNEQDQ